MKLELSAHNMLMFRNSSHFGLNVVYRREDGSIGWVDPRGLRHMNDTTCSGTHPANRRLFLAEIAPDPDNGVQPRGKPGCQLASPPNSQPPPSSVARAGSIRVSRNRPKCGTGMPTTCESGAPSGGCQDSAHYAAMTDDNLGVVENSACRSGCPSIDATRAPFAANDSPCRRLQCPVSRMTSCATGPPETCVPDRGNRLILPVAKIHFLQAPHLPRDLKGVQLCASKSAVCRARKRGETCHAA